MSAEKAYSLAWFRVDNSMVDHPKVEALGAKLGQPNAGWYIIRLWAWTMRYAPSGNLTTVARLSVERACDWRGTVGELIAAMLEVGVLEDLGDGSLEVHDWEHHQGGAVAKAQKDAERQKAARDSRKTVARPSTDGLKDGAGTRRDVTRRDDTEEALSSRLDPEAGKAKALEALTDDEFHVFEHWRLTLAHPKAVASGDRKRLIAKWLRVYTVAQLQDAIEGCAKSPHHMGQNDRNQRYDSLELILRDAKHIEDFMRLSGRVAA